MLVKKENENSTSDTNDLQWPRVVEFVADEEDDAFVRDFVEDYMKENSEALPQVRAVAHIYPYVLALTHF